MDVLQRGMTIILKSALTGEQGRLPKRFDLFKAGAVVKNQGIGAIFYYGAVLCGVEKKHPLMRELFKHTCQAISLHEHQMRVAEKVFDRFEENKIDYMPLKGTLLKKLYPKSEMRTMSDVDILIRTEQYEKIEPVMLELGYQLKVESDHEFVWRKDNMYVELHKRLIPSYNKDYYAYFGEGWRLAELCEEGGTRYRFKPEDEFIFIFTHFAKHYRDSGVGIRHILDIWVYMRAHPELDQEYIKNELQALQLYDFYVNIIKTLKVWFEGGKEDKVTQFITQIIFSSGLYGTYAVRVLSEGVKESKVTGKTTGLQKSSFLRELFMPYQDMCIRFPILKRAPFLLPIMWVVRWVHAILFRRKDIRIKSKRIRIMTSENIDKYQQALKFVGLDFNFKE